MNSFYRLLLTASLLLMPPALRLVNAQTSPPPRQTVPGPSLGVGDAIPPDTHGAVSEDYLVAVANYSIRIIRRDGSQPVRVANLGSWWNALRPSGEADFEPFDPVITYDPAGQRWIFASSSNAYDMMNSRMLIAVSQTADPAGAWYLYIFRVTDADFRFSPNSVWWDQPTIGFSRNFIAIDVTTIRSDSDSLIVLRKELAYRGVASAWRVRDDIPRRSCVVRNLDSSDGRLYVVAHADALRGRYSLMRGDINASGVFTFMQYVQPQALAFGHDYAGPRDSAHYANNAPQAPPAGSPAGTAGRMIAMGGEAIHSAMMRGGNIWLAHSAFITQETGAGTTHQAAVQWLQVSADTGVIQQIGRIGAPGLFHGYPGVAVNFRNDMVIGFSRTSANEWPGACYAFRDAADAPGTMRSTIIYGPGQAHYNRRGDDPRDQRNRWGDYSSACVDPRDDTTMWPLQEQALTDNIWGLRWAEVPAVTASVPQGTSPNTAGGVVGQPFSYTITATRGPASFEAEGLPPGLTLAPGSVPFTHLITGTPAASGSWTVSLRIGNAAGYSAHSVTIDISPSLLAEAVDNRHLTVTSGGDGADWFYQTAVTHDGSDAARSGPIIKSSETWMETTIRGPVTGSFWWKVSSEANYDLLRFSINGAVQATISGEVPWTERPFTVGTGVWRLRWAYRKDFARNAGQDAAWVDQLTYRTVMLATPDFAFNTNGNVLNEPFSWRPFPEPEPDLIVWSWTGPVPPGCLLDPLTGEISGTPTVQGNYIFDVHADNAAGRTTRTLTLDVSAVSLSSSAGTQIPLSTGGATGWFNDPKISHDTAASIRSGIVQDGEQSWCRANVTGPAMLSFWWMSSGRPADYAGFLCNGIPERQIGGVTGWRHEFIEIPAGPHEVRWMWDRGAGADPGLPQAPFESDDTENPLPPAPGDAVWVDQIELSPIVAPVLTGPFSLTVNRDAPVDLLFTASNGPQNFQLAGTLPAGVTLNPLSGRFSGYPEQAGIFPLTIKASNSAGFSQKAFDLTVDGSGLGPAIDQPAWMPASVSWFMQKVISYDGFSSAQSGPVTDNKSSDMTVTLTGPAEVCFWWKVSSEAGADTLAVQVNDQVQKVISGETAWQQECLTLPPGAHTLRWIYSKNNQGSAGADAGWVDQVKVDQLIGPAFFGSLAAGGRTGLPFQWCGDVRGRYNSVKVTGAKPLPPGLVLNSLNGDITGTPQINGTTTMELTASNPAGSAVFHLKIMIGPTALDAGLDSTLTAWRSGGDNPWFTQDTVSVNDGDAAQSGGIRDGKSSWMEGDIGGPGWLSFSWAVSSQRKYDRLIGMLDSKEIMAISGNKTWQDQRLWIPDGQHTVRWSYEKDVIACSDADAGWVDNVLFIAALAAPAVTCPPVPGAIAGQAWSLAFTAQPGPVTWEADGSLPDGLSFDAATGKISGTPLRSGAFPINVRATNEGGSGECKFTITVREPFDVWAAQFGLPEGEAGALLDNDHDGIPALIEYAAGTNPTSVADGPGAIPYMHDNDLLGGVSFHFRRRTDRPDLTWLVEASSDMQTWTPVVKISAANGITVIEPGYSVPQGPVDPIIVRLPGGSASGYLRLVVSGDR